MIGNVFQDYQTKLSTAWRLAFGGVYMSLCPHSKTYSVAIGFWPWWNNWKNSHIAVPPLNLPPRITFTLCFSLCAIVHCMRHLIFWFLIQKRGSRKGSIEIKKIRCVEKVNLEEQTPVERQYPFQVRGGTRTTFYWADGFCFNIFDCELSIWSITKGVAKWWRQWQGLTRPQMGAGHFAEILPTGLLRLEGEKKGWATLKESSHTKESSHSGLTCPGASQSFIKHC